MDLSKPPPGSKLSAEKWAILDDDLKIFIITEAQEKARFAQENKAKDEENARLKERADTNEKEAEKERQEKEKESQRADTNEREAKRARLDATEAQEELKVIMA